MPWVRGWVIQGTNVVDIPLEVHPYCTKLSLCWLHNVRCMERTSAFFNSYFMSSVRAWNSLPSDIVLYNSISAFKNALKVYYCF